MNILGYTNWVTFIPFAIVLVVISTMGALLFIQVNKYKLVLMGEAKSKEIASKKVKQLRIVEKILYISFMCYIIFNFIYEIITGKSFDFIIDSSIMAFLLLAMTFCKIIYIYYLRFLAKKQK